MSAYDEPESAFARACREEREEELRAKPRHAAMELAREFYRVGGWMGNGDGERDRIARDLGIAR